MSYISRNGYSAEQILEVIWEWRDNHMGGLRLGQYFYNKMDAGTYAFPELFYADTKDAERIIWTTYLE